MILSTETKSLRNRVGNERAIDIILDAGFDAVDFTFDQMCDPESILNSAKAEAYADSLAERVRRRGRCFNQAHAPFLFDWDDSVSFDSFILPAVKHSIALSGRLGVKQIVVHPIHHLVYAEKKDYLFDWNLEYFRELAPAAKQAGVKLALENMFQTDPLRGLPTADVFSDPRELLRMLEQLADPVFTACVDVGHIGLAGGRPADSLRILGRHVGALHIHDNDNHTDQHLPPFFGTLDWDGITQALSDIGYSGEFTFEAANYYVHFDEAFLPEAAAFLERIGRFLIRRVEERKETR